MSANGSRASYPDAAITESIKIWRLESIDRNPFGERLIDANIRGAAYYFCPQPVYMYPRHLMNDPTIQKHEQLWSQILIDYYQSDFHKNLERDAGYQRKLKQLVPQPS